MKTFCKWHIHLAYLIDFFCNSCCYWRAAVLEWATKHCADKQNVRFILVNETFDSMNRSIFRQNKVQPVFEVQALAVLHWWKQQTFSPLFHSLNGYGFGSETNFHSQCHNKSCNKTNCFIKQWLAFSTSIIALVRIFVRNDVFDVFLSLYILCWDILSSSIIAKRKFVESSR